MAFVHISALDRLRSSVLNATKNIIYWVLHLDLNNGVFVSDARPLFTGLPINHLFGLCETQQSTSLNGTILVFVSDKNLSCLCGFVLKTFIHLQRQEALALAVGLGSTVDFGMWDETWYTTEFWSSHYRFWYGGRIICSSVQVWERGSLVYLESLKFLLPFFNIICIKASSHLWIDTCVKDT